MYIIHNITLKMFTYFYIEKIPMYLNFEKVIQSRIWTPKYFFQTYVNTIFVFVTSNNLSTTLGLSMYVYLDAKNFAIDSRISEFRFLFCFYLKYTRLKI